MNTWRPSPSGVGGQNSAARLLARPCSSASVDLTRKERGRAGEREALSWLSAPVLSAMSGRNVDDHGRNAARTHPGSWLQNSTQRTKAPTPRLTQLQYLSVPKAESSNSGENQIEFEWISYRSAHPMRLMMILFCILPVLFFSLGVQ